MNKLSILLATYNGEKFLSELIISLLKQTYDDFKIFISDDCSSDNTIAIINKFTNEYPNKIVNLTSGIRFGNARDNFFYLLSKVDSELYMFCDQDDVWMTNKIEETINSYDKLPNKEIPILIHSDLCVVKKDLSVINNSFFNMMKLSTKNYSWRNYLVQNNVTGCTMLINNIAANYYKKSLTINNSNILMHDYFFAIIVSLTGEIYFINKPLLYYRQHENNSVGAKKVYSFKFFLSELKNLKTKKEYIIASEKQISEIYKILLNTDFLSDEKKSVLERYSVLYEYPKAYRIYFILKNRLLKKTFLRKLYQLLLI